MSLQRVAKLLCAGLLVTTALAQAQTYTILHNFTGTDGANPTSTLVLDRAGNFYGTTQNGGSYNKGVLFQLKAAGSGWVLRPLHEFGQVVSDGYEPLNYGGLAFGPDGTLYGTTNSGGLLECGEGQSYCGVVFRLQPPPTACTSALCPWNYTVVHQFTSYPSDVSIPESGVVFDGAGNMYGTTYGGGIYQISPSGGGWTESVIGELGNETFPAMVADSAGNLYGIWTEGFNTYGGVFELSPSASGWTETVLYRFTGSSDGSTPMGGLVRDNAGNLYGSTSDGGSGGGGTIFELSPSAGGWAFHLLWNFPGSGFSGPQSALSFDTQGNLYGTTFHGGRHGGGSVFQCTHIGSNWVCDDLYDFEQGSNGSFPVGGVTLDSQGNLYGTTNVGGSGCGLYGCGVIWKITP